MRGFLIMLDGAWVSHRVLLEPCESIRSVVASICAKRYAKSPPSDMYVHLPIRVASVAISGSIIALSKQSPRCCSKCTSVASWFEWQCEFRHWKLSPGRGHKWAGVITRKSRIIKLPLPGNRGDFWLGGEIWGGCLCEYPLPTCPFLTAGFSRDWTHKFADRLHDIVCPLVDNCTRQPPRWVLEFACRRDLSLECGSFGKWNRSD
jgi:hypothetical protein